MHQELGTILKMKQILKLFFILLLLLFASCSSQTQDKELKIATNSWIGYTPLFYTQEKGEFKKLDMKLIQNVFLNRSNGGDIIFSNKILTQIKEAKKIYAYLELDSINRKLLQVLKDMQYKTEFIEL